MRAHHNQLRKWREAPLYLKNDPVYELCRIRTMEREIKDTWIDLTERRVILVEEREKIEKGGTEEEMDGDD